MTAKEKARAKRLMDNYKLTPEQYEIISAYQGHVCYMCERPEPVAGRRLAVDHDWVTGEIRGLLCSRCNPILGKLERAFIRYGLHKVPMAVVQFAYKLYMYLGSIPARKALGHIHYGYKGRTGTKAHRKRIQQDRKRMTSSTLPLQR